MSGDFIGKDYVDYPSVLNSSHTDESRGGLKSVEIIKDFEGKPTLIFHTHPDGTETFITAARITYNDGTIWEDWGDADAKSVRNRSIQPHLLRMAFCVPLRAKILTFDGWKRHDEVKMGSPVLAYDLENDACTWTPLMDVSLFESIPTVRLSSRSFEVVCTPDHSWPVVGSGKPRMERAWSFRTGDSIVVAAQCFEGGSLDVDEQDAAILGWLATDGTIREAMVGDYGPYTRGVIRQSKPQYVAELATLTAQVATETTSAARDRDFGAYVSHCLPQHTFNLTTGYLPDLLKRIGFASWEDLPTIVLRLPAKARAPMLDAMLKGDGYQKGKDRWVFGKKRKPGVMEAFELLCVLQGRALGRLHIGPNNGVPYRTVRANRFVSTSYLEWEDDNDQPVWCPTTRFGTWVMNLDGCITITGNTRAKGRAMRDALNKGKPIVEEFGPDGTDASNDDERPASKPAESGTTDYSRKNGNSTPPPEAAGPVESSGDEELDGLLQRFAEGTKLPPPQAERQACKGGSIPAGTTLATATDQQRENAKRWLKSMLAKPGRP